MAWTCICGERNGNRYCPQCGRRQPFNRLRQFAPFGLLLLLIGVLVVALVTPSTDNDSKGAVSGSPKEAGTVATTAGAPVPITDAPIEIPPHPQKSDEVRNARPGSYPDAHMLGDVFSVGYWKYRINGSLWTPIVGSAFEAERANAAFLVVDISVENEDRTESTLPVIKLRDFQNREYERSTAGMFGDGFFGILESFNPGVGKRGRIAFDVPPNREYILVVSGGYTSGVHALVLLGDVSAPKQAAETRTVPPAASGPPPSDTPSSPSETQPAPVQATEPVPPATVPSVVPQSSSPSGVLCNGPVNVPHNGELTFKDLPAQRLHFIFDSQLWQLTIKRQVDQKQTVVLRSLRTGDRSVCDVRWELVE